MGGLKIIEVPTIASPVVLRIKIEMLATGQAMLIECGDPQTLPITGKLGPVDTLLVAGVLAKMAGALIEQGRAANASKEKIITTEKIG